MYLSVVSQLILSNPRLSKQIMSSPNVSRIQGELCKIQRYMFGTSFVLLVINSTIWWFHCFHFSQSFNGFRIVRVNRSLIVVRVERAPHGARLGTGHTHTFITANRFSRSTFPQYSQLTSSKEYVSMEHEEYRNQIIRVSDKVCLAVDKVKK